MAWWPSAALQSGGEGLICAAWVSSPLLPVTVVPLLLLPPLLLYCQLLMCVASC